MTADVATQSQQTQSQGTSLQLGLLQKLAQLKPRSETHSAASSEAQPFWQLAGSVMVMTDND